MRIKYIYMFLNFFIIIVFLAYSGILDTDSPTEVVKRYYHALQTHQDHLALRLLEEFDWKLIQPFYQKSVKVNWYGRFFNFRKERGLIKNFQIINSTIDGNLAEVQLKIRWFDGNVAIDKVKLSNKTGKWKILSAEIYY